MRVKVVKASFGITINTGDYNNAKVDFGGEAEVGGADGLTLEEANERYDRLFQQVFEKVREKVPQAIAASKEAAVAAKQPASGPTGRYTRPL